MAAESSEAPFRPVPGTTERRGCGLLRMPWHSAAVHVTVIDHPLAAARLAALRAEDTVNADFRRALAELSGFLVYEATRGLPLAETELRTPMGPAKGKRIAAQPVLVPVLRAGLGMLGAALDLLPDASVGFIGLRRDEQTLRPEAYMNSVGGDLGGCDVLVLDPMLATGGSAVHACETIRASAAGRITLVCALAAPEGIEALRQTGSADAVVTAAVDDSLNETGFIVPGLGDAGDRQFGLNP